MGHKSLRATTRLLKHPNTHSFSLLNQFPSFCFHVFAYLQFITIIKYIVTHWLIIEYTVIHWVILIRMWLMHTVYQRSHGLICPNEMHSAVYLLSVIATGSKSNAKSKAACARRSTYEECCFKYVEALTAVQHFNVFCCEMNEWILAEL